MAPLQLDQRSVFSQLFNANANRAVSLKKSLQNSQVNNINFCVRYYLNSNSKMHFPTDEYISSDIYKPSKINRSTLTIGTRFNLASWINWSNAKKVCFY